MTDPITRSGERVILTARRLVHRQRDEHNIPVTEFTLTAVVTEHELALAAAEREQGQKEKP